MSPQLIARIEKRGAFFGILICFCTTTKSRVPTPRQEQTNELFASAVRSESRAQTVSPHPRTASQYSHVSRFVQPGPDGKLDTADDIKTADTLFIEQGKTYHYKLTSLDVLHNFSVPVFRLKQDD